MNPVIVKYQDSNINIDVLFEHDSFWLNLNQISELYEKSKSVINNHVLNILEEEGFNKNLTNFYLGRLVQYAYMTEKDFVDEIISNSMKLSLDLKNNFYNLFKESLAIVEIPHILSDIGILHLIDLCFSSSFMRENTKNLIEKVDGNESEIYFSTIYILKNSKLLGSDFVNKNLTNILPKIKQINNLENKVLLTTLIDFFKEKGKLKLNDDLNKKIENLVYKYKKNYPELFQKLFSIKKNNILDLKRNLDKNI